MLMSQSSLALSNLRAVVIVIVVAFHSCLAYLASAPVKILPFDRAPYHWQAFPIVDAQSWLGLDVFCAWQDLSLMAIMFFLSGVFAAPSLMRKGSLKYLSDRVWRIAVPFVLAVILLSPLAIYPAYALRADNASLAGFFRAWMQLPFWPSGPEWFLWQLFAVNALAAILYAIAPGCIEAFRRFAGWSAQRPLAFFLALAAASVAAYVPLALIFSPWHWSSLGPFSLQLCRPLLYIVFFFAAFAIGSRGIDRGLLSCDGPLARRWALWLGAAVVSFLLWAGITSLTQPDWFAAPIAVRLGASLAFAVACPAGGLFLVAACLRFARRRFWILDSLSANAYGMYLVHYVFVVWLQYLLLPDALPAVAKALIVFGGSLVLSWASSVAFTRLLRVSYPRSPDVRCRRCRADAPRGGTDGMPLTFTLAARNLFHDRLRFVATMVGIVFSVVLVMVQMGLYLGFGRMVTTMIDHASTDLWVVRRGTKAFEDPSLLEAKTQKAVLSVPGVAKARPLVIGFSDWRLPDGEMTPVFIVGSDLQNPGSAAVGYRRGQHRGARTSPAALPSIDSTSSASVYPASAARRISAASRCMSSR